MALLFAGGLILSILAPAADITGLWTGQVAGRGGEKQDISFQFKTLKNVLTGKMFGDEFDVPVQGLQVSGDHITFYTTTTNYYDGSKTKFNFTGTITDKEIQLTREREARAELEAPAKDAKKGDRKQTFTLKRLTS
ncbi:MAG: hypothetical protein ABJF23_00810 [Bryobacteraceae bacterium]